MMKTSHKVYQLDDFQHRWVSENSDRTFTIDNKKASKRFIRKYERFVVERTASKFLINLKNLFGNMSGSFYSAKTSPWVKSLYYLVIPGPSGLYKGNILDIGCSSGAFLENLSKGWVKRGVEVNEEACKIGRKKGLVIDNSVIETYFPRQKFNVIRASHVIEHTRNPALFVKKVCSLVLPGGRIIIYTPNFDSFSRNTFDSSWEGFYDETHFNIFCKDSLKYLFHQNGFELIKTDSYHMGYTVSSFCRYLGVRNSRAFSTFFPLLYLVSLFLSQIRYLFPKRLQGGALYMEFVNKNKK